MPRRFSMPAALSAALLVGCGSDESRPEPIPAEGGLDIAVCDPGAGPFSPVIDNEFLPLPEGKAQVLTGTEDGVALRLEIRVLAETFEVAGVTTRVVEERDLEDGELAEVSRNYVAQAPDGSVCYFGEDVDVYAGGVVTGHPGAWLADPAGGTDRPGLLMPAPAPAVGDYWSQEVAPGVALDRAEVVGVGETFVVPAGTYHDTIRTREWTPLEPDDEEFKVYARGVGLVIDAAVALEPPAP
jgi:hypothetical protein